ncbi:DEKNAAC100288 [Brettanomyces naardenensis]|uniref:DEKNAAC100288 n=1 Tax=Brettanomyces naardenensis TaxID=13370 RepID=A0A448YF55_BRENA|nr:DEKNAAC100288 [Brettanomyces naardenensis]
MSETSQQQQQQHPREPLSELSTYDGIEAVAHIAERVRTSDLSLSNIGNSAENLSNSSSFTVRSDRANDGYKDLDLEFETFSGSVADFAEKVPVYVDTSASTEDLPVGEGDDGDITLNTQNTILSDYDEENKENVSVMRTWNVSKKIIPTKEPSVVDFSKLNSYRGISSRLTAKKAPEPDIDLIKLQQLDSSMTAITSKISKMQKELHVLDELLPDTYDGSEVSQTLEYKKLKFARDRLDEKCETLKKQRYELCIKINNRLKKVYGSNESDRSHYWVSAKGL